MQYIVATAEFANAEVIIFTGCMDHLDLYLCVTFAIETLPTRASTLMTFLRRT